MNSRPEAWLHQARNDLAAGINTGELNALPLRGLSRMAIQSRYPVDATPPSDLFDQGDAKQALTTARSLLSILEALDR